MVQISKDCLNEVIIISLQEVIKRPLKGNIPGPQSVETSLNDKVVKMSLLTYI